jgi:O-antigen ligase
VSAVISLLIVFATTAFGAVYPWGYTPLFVAAACIGAIGLVREAGVPAEVRALAIGLLFVVLAVGGQLVPVPGAALDFLSPQVARLLSRYSLTFAASGEHHSLSIDAGATRLAMMGLAGLGLYLIGLPCLLSRRDLHKLPRNLILFAVVLALVGVFGREHNNGLVYGFWQPEEGSNGNGFGPFVNRNHFAGWMLMATCLSIGVLCGRMEVIGRGFKPGLRNRIVWCSTSEASRIMLIAAGVVVMAISLVWTMSRSGIISFTCAVLGFVWLVARRRDVGKGRRVVVLCTLGIVLLASVSWRGIDHLGEWFGNTRDIESRFEAWKDGWHVVRDFPIAGTGLNTYRDAMVFYQQHVTDVWMTHAHNDYLQFLAEGGLLVSLPAIAAVALLGITIRRRLNEARGDGYDYWVRAGASMGLVAIGIQEMAEFSLQMPANAFLFATLASIAITRRIGAPRRLQILVAVDPLGHRPNGSERGTRSSASPVRVQVGVADDGRLRERVLSRSKRPARYSV